MAGCIAALALWLCATPSPGQSAVAGMGGEAATASNATLSGTVLSGTAASRGDTDPAEESNLPRTTAVLPDAVLRRAAAIALESVPYTIGSGDVLSISVWKEKELSPSVTVRPDGKISMPLIGEVPVVGMTPVQAEVLLSSRLKSIVLNPRVTVTVAEIHSRMVYITGEIGRPGAYPLNGPLDVLQLIAQAGGLTEFAARSKIRILRANSTDKGMRFDYNSVLRSGKPERNVALTPGDTVVVP